MARTIPKPVLGPKGDEFAQPRELAHKIKRLMLTPKARDKQIRIGPSAVGNPCEVCLAGQMSLILGGHTRPNRMSLSSWIGTACHERLDRLVEEMDWEGIFGERVLDCGEIPGYGPIKGSTDLYGRSYATVFDYKFVGQRTFTKMRKNGMSTQYVYQRQTYGLGIEMLGEPIEFVGNIVFRAGGFDFDNDMIVDIERYDPEFAHAAFERAGVLFNEYVLTGRMEELESDPDCWPCSGLQEYM